MSLLPRRRPSPAMLVALLALVLATTGTATAAALITSPDQLADSVVSNSKLAPGAVTNSKLGDNQVNSRTLSFGAVGKEKLGTRAVDEQVLAQASVGNFNLQDGAVTNSKMVNPVFSARLGADGTAERFVGVDRSQTRRVGTGRYEVTFERPVDNCVITAQIRGSSPGLTDTIQVEDPTSSRPKTVSITTQAAVVPSTGNPGTSPILSVSVDRRFDLIAAC